MTIRNGIHVTRAGRVLEYALYYYADIQHVYELEHCWMYLNAREELIGVKATRHGVFMTLFFYTPINSIFQRSSNSICGTW